MIAALFPGQGSQSVGMARDLYERSTAAQRVLDDAEAALPGLLSLMFEGPADELQLTANQQPALVAAGAAAYAAYLERGGERPSYAAGHSLGEFTAHVATGTLQLGDAVALVRKRGEYMQKVVPAGEGAMAAILKVTPDVVRAACDATEGVVEVANLNAPGQTVISGRAGPVAAAGERLKGEGARVIPLKVSAPFHCALMQPAADALARGLAATTFHPPLYPIVCNVTAEVLASVDHAPSLLTQQVTSAVRWTQSVERLAALGVTRWIEFGSGKVLSGLVARILDDPDTHAVVDGATLEEAS